MKHGIYTLAVLMLIAASLASAQIQSNGTGGGDWNSTTTWQGGVVPSATDSVVILGTDSVYVLVNSSCAGLLVQTGGRIGLGAKLTATNISLNGKATVYADTLNATASMTVGATGVYEHARNGGRIPTATWTPGATLLITGVTSTAPGNGNQNFHHIIWNSPAQTGNINLGWNGNTIGGNITVLNTGTGRWQLCAPAANTSATVTIMGDVVQSGGSFTTNGTSNAGTAITINHYGSINVTGGNFSISRGSQGGTGTSTWNLLGGNFTMTNATTQNSNTAGAKFVMAGTGPQAVTFSNDSLGSSSAVPIEIASGSVTTLSLSNINYAARGFPVRVRSGATLKMGTTQFGGNGSFTLDSVATLESGHADGLNGNIITTGTISLSPFATYVFNGALAQTTGDLLPDTVATLTINNSSGVTLSDTVTSTQTLNLTDGVFSTGSNLVILLPQASVNRTAGHVNGYLQKTVGSPADTLTFEIGSASAYTPVTIAGTSYSAAFDVLAWTTGADHPNISTSGIDATKSVNRYYSLNGTPTGPSDITFNFVAADVDPSANPLNFTIKKYETGWSALTVGARTATSTQALGVSDFSDFAIGEPVPTRIVSNGTGGGEWSNGATWVGGIVPGATDTAVIAGTDSVYINASATAAVIVVQAGARLALNAKLTGDSLWLGGRAIVNADTLNTSRMFVGGSGTYQHARNGGRIPTATWATGSTILFTGITANAPSNGNQNFHHVIWNSPAQTANLNLGWDGNTIGGNITVLNTGTGRWQMCAPAANDSAVVIVMGDVVQSAGQFTTNGTSNANTHIVINHYGNITVTGGNFSISRGSQGGSGTSVWNLLNGNFTMSDATTQNSNAAGARFVFTRAGLQSLTLSNVTFAGGGLPITVNSGTSLSTGTSVLRGSGAFILNPLSWLICGHEGGLDSLLQNTGTRSLSKSASYEFDGTAQQITGALLPDTVMRLVVNNAAGVRMSAGTTVNVSLQLASGDLDLNGQTVTLGPTAVLVESPGNTVKGTSGVITTTRNLSAPSDTVDIAGLGIGIGSSANLGSTILVRGHAVQTAGNRSISRYFDITPTNNTGLNATLRFRYDESELEGTPENELRLFRSTDGGATWALRGGSVDTLTNVITLSGIGELSRWTAARVGAPPSVSGVARSTRVPAAGDTLVVTCTITDSVGVASASLIYNVNGTPNSVAMVRTSGTPQDGTYRGVIPGSANANGNRIEYQIQAVSIGGVSTTTPIARTNSYYAGISPLSLTGLRRMHPDGRIIDSLYYARVTGTVNGPNFQTTNLGYHFQDAVGGIQLFSFGITIPPLNVGDSIIVLGRIAQFRGLTEIIPDTQATDIQVVATGRPVTPVTVRVRDFAANPELYESRLVRIDTLRRRDATPPWPGPGTSANIVMYQHVLTDTIIMRIDSDTEIPGSPEPVYPVNVTGVMTQFSSATNVYNNGYQTQPRFRTDLQTVVDVAEPEGVPLTFGLEQNYPNPFNPATQIRYSLAKESFVMLSVYNLLGQHVRTLAREQQKAGRVTASWDGRNALGSPVGSGVYFYRLEARPTDGSAAFVSVKKMIMVR